MPPKQQLAIAVVFTAVLTTAAQKTKRPARAAAPPAAIFAVTSAGQTIQPVAQVIKGTLTAVGDDQKAFARQYYKPKTTYRLIFGGTDAGTVSISKANYPGECAGNSAETVTTSKTAKLSESVMALAADGSLKTPATGVRRRPTVPERLAIEKLVRAEFAKQKVSAASTKTLRYQNLTALDVDGDGTPEFVGSYWVAVSDSERDLLFFIAGKEGKSDYELGYSEFSKITPNEVMSGELADLDKGIGHELLLDVLDYDEDGKAEIFTIGKAFEGDNLYAYKHGDAGWKRVFETYNYRCAF